MDADIIQLQAEITHLKKEAKAWENVHIAVYVLKEADGALPASAAYLTELETPCYRTLKLSEDKIANIYFANEEEEEIMDAGDFYDTMVENSRNDHIYTILHGDFESGQNLQEIIREGRMVVNKNRLPYDLKQDTLTEALKNGAINLENLFEEDGYLVANVNRVAHLSSRIEKVVGAFDRAGRLFYEVQFI